MFKKLLASVGIGAAQVDTQLEQELLTPGQFFRADVVVVGGEVAQEISGLKIGLLTRVEVETENGEYTENHVLQQWQVAGTFILSPAEKKVLPFEAALPLETPITEVQCRYNKTRVWLQTGMAIDLGRDASDRDFLRTAPTPAMRAFLDAMKTCGFSLYQADVEKGYLRARDFHSRSGCYQELELRPAGFGQWEINEIEVSFVPDEGFTHVMLEVDRKFRRDKLTTLTLYHDRLNSHALAEQIQGMLR